LYNARIAIVGAGEAGARVAIVLRAEGHVGPLTLVGDETHAPYERPPLSKALIVTPESPWLPAIADAGELAKKGVEYAAGVRATSIDRGSREIALSDGRTLGYDALLLATGAKPRKLNVLGAEGALMLRNFEDSLALRARFLPGQNIAIIGGGFIGLELAASAIALGCKVRIIEAASRILARGVPAEIAELIEHRHRAAGVDFVIGLGIASISAGQGVVLSDGRLVKADCVVVGIGAIPETSLASAAGLAIDNGVAVDGRMRTSDPAILAVGDCASFPHPLYGGRRIRLEAWRNALDQGTYVAKSLLVVGEEYQAVPWFWSDQYELCLQIAGLADGAAQSVKRDLGDGALMLFHLADGGKLIAASAFGPLGKVAREIRLAEMLIAKGAKADPADLASPAIKLKSLLAS
jgi:3-phenylpropionate/trans-cinnamate dioxygenase ferredoxin reductase component